PIVSTPAFPPENAFAVVLAGGQGRRLWPLSRPTWPKPFLPLFPGDRAPLAETLARLAPLLPPERILVVVEEAHRAPALSLLPPGARLLCEPWGRGTAAALGLAAVHLAALAPGATVVAIPADKWVEAGSPYEEDLRAALVLAAAGEFVLVGTEALEPATGYGYLLPGHAVRSVGGRPVFRLEGFVEKPDRQRAAELVDRGSLWHAGLFAFSPGEFLAVLRFFQPRLGEALARVGAALGSVDYEVVLRKAWRELAPVSLEEGLFTRDPHRLLVVRGTHRWLDLGTWDALRRTALATGKENAVCGRTVLIDCEGCLIRAEGGRPVAALGLRDLVIVDTPVALLVMAPDRGEEVRRVAAIITREEM
ncbi:MAG: mannose-1-phosphate guanylyltransferase, partial [Firmicutes bacterium]|nr:mannose-1-phosphate guanylyltransferase [Bacillota bacterium]